MRRLSLFILSFLMVPSCGWHRPGIVKPDVWTGSVADVVPSNVLVNGMIPNGYI